MTEPIQFHRRTETAAFYSPLAGMEFAEDRVEVRTDPLTGMTAVASAGLEAKEEMFLGRADWAYTDLLVARSREGCFFCPEKVLEATPRYPDELVPGGRLERGRALVFPNLFPLAGVHAVVTFPEEHFLRPSQFTPSLLEEGLGAALDFARRAAAFYPADDAHLRLLQPHAARRRQPRAPPLPGVRRRDRALAGPALLGPLGRLARRSTGRATGGRWSSRSAPPASATSGERPASTGWCRSRRPAPARRSPSCPARARLTDLQDEHVAALAHGLTRILTWYEDEGLSAFNFTLSGGPLNGRDTGFPVVVRVIARTAFKQDYRTDDYFLQKQLGGELMFAAPEEMAARLQNAVLIWPVEHREEE